VWGGLLLGLAVPEKNAGEKTRTSYHQPLNSPELNNLNIEVVLNADETNGNSDDHECDAQEKRAQGWQRQSEPILNATELQGTQKIEVFDPTLGGYEIGAMTTGATDMTKSGPDHKLGPATPTRLG